MKKRMLAIVMSLMMVVVFIPTVAFADDPPANQAKLYIGAASTGTEYATLAEAVAAAEADTTTSAKEIELLDNVTLSSTQEISKDLIIDLNGKKITGDKARALQVKEGTLSLKGLGTVTSDVADVESSVIRVGDANANADAGLIVGDNVSITTATAYGVTAFGAKDEKVEINGTIASTAPANEAFDGCALSSFGSDTTGAKFIVNAGAELSSKNANGIYLPSGELEIKGGTITGTTGVYAKSKKVTISGGTIHGTGNAAAYNDFNDGGKSTGEALVLDNCGGPSYGPLDTVKVTGGTFISDKADAIGSYPETDKKTNFISGGQFSSEIPYEYAAKGYVPVHKASAGYYGVESFGNEHATVIAGLSPVKKATEMTDGTKVVVDKTDAAKFATGLSEDAVISVLLETENVSGTVATETSGAYAISKALSEGQTISYYIDAKISYKVGNNGPYDVTDTSAYQILAFKLDNKLDVNKAIVFRAHGTTTQTVTQLMKASKADFESADGECYCVDRTGSAQTVFVKANKFSVYGIGTQATAPEEQCQVTFDSKGGSAVDPIAVKAGSTFTKPTDPTKDKAVFKGWYKEPECTNVWNFETDKVTANMTLYAKWADAVTVTYDANGHGTAPAAQKIEKDTAIGTAPVVPTASGYTFKGWFKEAGCTNAWDFTKDKVTTDITLYAKWVKITDISDFTATPDEERNDYTGDVIHPTVTVVDEAGAEVPSTSYTVSYEPGCKAIGEYEIYIDGAGDCTGHIETSFEIDPNAPILKSVQKGKKSFTAKWSKKTEKITKYQLMYSRDSSFTGSTTKKKACSPSAVKATVKNLKSKKTYYVKIRSYKTVDEQKFWSDWSNVEKVKVK